MSNIKTVRVGVMPGRIQEVAVEVGSAVADVIAIAELNPQGYDVKVDGVKVDPTNTTICGETSLILLAKQVKGNATVRIGIMPGRITEYAFDDNTTVQEALNEAGLDANGYDVKLDGTKVTDLNSNTVAGVSLILLAKQVKGNVETTVRVGVMPGRITEYVVDSGTTVNELLAIAELSPQGYDVKADGTKVENLDAPIGSTSLILLAKQVKGNGQVRVGIMPGRITEYAVEDNATVAEILEIAELDASGYDVKVDGVKVTDFGTQAGTASLILLAKQVKGNK